MVDLLEQRGAGVYAEVASDRVKALAAIALDIARMGARELAECIESHAIDTATRVLFSIRMQLDDARVPPSWKQRLEPWLASPALAIDGAALKARETGADELRMLASDYGHALAVWPALWQHCVEVNA
jgi:hypothetical protein